MRKHFGMLLMALSLTPMAQASPKDLPDSCGDNKVQFDVKLQPGQSFSYTFKRPGEYFFNDCYSPRPTGKIEVYR